mgnify:CR=1 FL=1
MSAKECDKTKIFRLFVLFLWFEFGTTSIVSFGITTARTRVYSISLTLNLQEKISGVKLLHVVHRQTWLVNFCPPLHTLDNNLCFCSTKNIMLFYYFLSPFFCNKNHFTIGYQTEVKAAYPHFNHAG